VQEELEDTKEAIRIRVAANKEATEPRIPFGKVEVITSKIYTFRSFPHSRLITGTDNTMAKGKNTKEQTTIYKTYI
jgi:hypothetical protein